MNVSKSKCIIAASFVAAFGFFYIAYPYHLMRREQLTLFLYDIPYIFRTYRGAGFASRFISDFLEQFFCLKAAGPIVVSALLTAIGVLAYKISRAFAGKKISFVIASLIWIWSLLRETETIYMTQYTVAVAGYLLCVFFALKFKQTATKIGSLLVFVALGLWLFGNPYHKNYGKLIGRPDLEYEKLVAADIETFRENWDKVIKISESGLLYNEACYLYNLAYAMQGRLSETLLHHPQNYTSGLFCFVTDQVSPFSNGMAGEVWYHLGNMTLADQSAMVTMQSSPKHTGARFVKRLAMINLVTGQYGAAQKYLSMLGRTMFYHKWAEKMLPDNQDAQTREYIEGLRRNLIADDVVSGTNDYKLLLGKLLSANPDNKMAREYLLCYELLSCDLASFMDDYVPEKNNPALYQEATMVWINIRHSEGNLDKVDMDKFGIDADTIERLRRFYRYPEKYKDTYWYYYTYAME